MRDVPTKASSRRASNEITLCPILELGMSMRPLIDSALPRLLGNFPGAAGNCSNLTKALDIAKFTSNFKALANMERE